MADPNVNTPLLTSSNSDESPELVLTIDEDDKRHDPDTNSPTRKSSSQNRSRNRTSAIRNHSHDGPHGSTDGTQLNSRNPFEFIGCEGLHVPPPCTIDPFRNQTPGIGGVYECLKIVTCTPIAIVRLVLFGLCLGVGYIATKLALLGWKDKDNPMPKWRCRLMWITRYCARFILFSFGYQWIKRKGKPAPREIAPIVVSNHVSYIEPIFYFYELFSTIVASESHDSLPFVGIIIRAMQVIYVNRFVPSSRKHAVNEIKKRAASNMFPRVLLFPEGTTTNGRNLISFQLGAFIPGFPIQPVVVRYPHVHFDQSWGNVSLAKLMFRMFTQFHNYFEVEYLPVIYPLNKKETAGQFAQRSSYALATALNVVQTAHSYGDVMLLMKAIATKQERPSCYLVEMAKVQSLHHISGLEAVDLLDKFLQMNPDSSGRVLYHDFLRAMRIKACAISEEIFAFVDVEKAGTITFKQFLYGSAYVMNRPLFRKACESAFAECSAGGKDYITGKELQDYIRQAIPVWKEDEVPEFFMLFDADSDGRISGDDFLACLRKNPLLIALFIPSLMERDVSVTDNRMLEIVLS